MESKITEQVLKKQNKSKKIVDGTRARFSPITVVMLVLLIAYAATLLFLLVWAGFTAFADNETYVGSIANKDSLFPSVFRWNFSDIFERFNYDIGDNQVVDFVGMFANSLLYSVGSALVKTAITCVTAYACARFDYKFSKVIYGIVIVTMIMPIVGSLPSEIDMATRLGLYDSIPGMWVMKSNFLGMYFLVFYAMFKNVPKAYEEAAKIDGANNFQIMSRVHFPICRNTFFTIMLILFVEYWNDFQTPLVYLDHFPTVSLGLYKIMLSTETELTQLSMKMAATFLVVVPTLVVFLIFQKRLMGNLTVGGIKG